MTGPVVLGGPLSPVGWGVGFVDASLDACVTTLTTWWTGIGIRHRVTPSSGALLDQLRTLDPLEADSTRRLLVETSGAWTACFDNSLDGGDQASWCTEIAFRLGVRCALASHVPVGHYPYPSTQLELLGPDGQPPLMYVRTLSAGIYDSGRWEWYASGAPQPWEDVERYAERRVRDRLDRPLLLRYLGRLGIAADDPGFYGDGVLVTKEIGRRRARRARRETVADLQREYGISEPEI